MLQVLQENNLPAIVPSRTNGALKPPIGSHFAAIATYFTGAGGGNGASSELAETSEANFVASRTG